MSSISARRAYPLLRSSLSSTKQPGSAYRIPFQSPNAILRPFSTTPIPSAYVNSNSKPAASTATPSRLASTPIKPKFTPTASEPPPETVRTSSVDESTRNLRSLTDGLDDTPVELNENAKQIDWTRSYHGLGNAAFSAEASQVLLAPIEPDDVEVKPDGIVYLPEIKYRRILNRAFGPGGWGLAPRGESIVTGKLITREYALVVQGRLVSIARGEMQYFDPDGIPTATEGCKSNALMRCCKDIGIASELWDPRFIRKFLSEKTKEVWVEHVTTKKKRKVVIRKDDVVKYPFKEVKM
ncbi:mitochondrial genome maintenance protein MGM101 [Glonium stellatum]|uniref:Mitochondrial genome maintenance protein MGM101 n=1 Tax=Glonium stellatum TaxID=574774 RepID=A0A8E2JW79_9PEZI|nr:mitochondrial genome maintenance protein MGM101 [Glonium stellatum]